MTEIRSVSLRIVSLILVAGLLLAGFSQMYIGNSVARLQGSPLNLQVPVILQSQSTSCGEAVIVMAYNFAYPQQRFTEQEVMEYASAQVYYTEELSPFTTPANMVKIAKHSADNVSTGRVISSNQGLALLIGELRAGEPIIIDVLSNFQDPDSEAHFVVVTGISTDPKRENAILISYNDPLTGNHESADWLGEEGLWNAWHNNGDPGGSGWWMVIPPP